MPDGWFDWLSGESRRAFADEANRWFDRSLRRYGGPHLHAALMGSPADPANGQPARGGILTGLAEMSPAADMRDLLEGSGQVMAGRPLEGGALMAASLAGTMIPGSAGGYRQAAEEATQGIRAYHGSPHDFDKFSLERIGTGEGATAYGHGLYFAENEKVAKSYRNALSPGGGTTPADVAARILEDTDGDYDKAVSVANWRLNAWLSAPKSSRTPDGYERLMEVKRLLINRAPVKGRMYEVSINADPTDFIDFDKPVAQQSERVKEAIERVLGNVQNPESTYIQPPNAATAKAFREAGVPGVKYLDQASRGDGEGTRNFVVFDDSLIQIMRKYGMLPPLVAAGGGALLLNQPSEAQAREPR